jgi:AcrR family transcriptional regulator
MGGLSDMPARSVRRKPRKRTQLSPSENAAPGAREEPSERYRRLPTGTHGLDPEEVQRDQRERLRTAMIELIARRGYRAVRVLDVTKLARVSRPTFYSLYADKEALFLDAYDEISGRAARAVVAAYEAEGSEGEHLKVAIRAFAALAAAEPEAMSLFVLGAFGAGAKALERRNRTLEALEELIRRHRDPDSSERRVDLTVKVLLGGVREVTAARLRRGDSSELPELARELSAWAASYPLKLPPELAVSRPAGRRSSDAAPSLISERAKRAEGRLPSGRHALSRKYIVQNQRERIVDATAATVAAKGLAGLTIPEIARRANVSHQTFYEIYPSKHDAFLGALKVGMHQALRVTAEAYEAHGDDWPRGMAAGMYTLIDYLASEPAHAHLSLVDTFAASPDAIEIRDQALEAFAAYLRRGYAQAPKSRKLPAIAAEAVTGGIWQVFHDYIDAGRIKELPGLAPQIVYLALVPFLGPRAAVKAARRRESALS